MGQQIDDIYSKYILNKKGLEHEMQYCYSNIDLWWQTNEIKVNQYTPGKVFETESLLILQP